jgi:hypothetical protein
MTDSELDGLLLLAYFPGRKDKLNLSRKETFLNSIVERIIKNNLESELGENIISFLDIKIIEKKEIGIIVFKTFMADIQIVKMAALKTFDEYKEMIK